MRAPAPRRCAAGELCEPAELRILSGPERIRSSVPLVTLALLRSGVARRDRSSFVILVSDCRLTGIRGGVALVPACRAGNPLSHHLSCTIHRERRRCAMAGSVTVKGVVRGKTIELERSPGLPDGQQVTVTVQASAADAGAGAGEGIRRSAGAWADDVAGLDQYLEWSRRQR